MTSSSAAMLDCEYEKNSPAHISASAASRRPLRERLVASRVSTTPMPSTTWRPYRLGSPNSEVTLKKSVLAFETARLGA